MTHTIAKLEKYSLLMRYPQSLEISERVATIEMPAAVDNLLGELNLADLGPATLMSAHGVGATFWLQDFNKHDLVGKKGRLYFVVEEM